MGNIKISFVDYSDRKRIHLKPDIVEYACNGALLLYNLVLGKQTLPDLGVVLDFKEENKEKCPITLILLFALLIDLPDLCIYPKTVIVLHPLFKSTHKIK